MVAKVACVWPTWLICNDVGHVGDEMSLIFGDVGDEMCLIFGDVGDECV